MQLTNIRAEDIVQCNVRGRVFLAQVQEKEGRQLRVNPIEKGINYFTVKGNQVVGHWKRMGRKRG